MNKIRVQGWDISLNHAGIVELVDGELSNFWFVTSHKGSIVQNKDHSIELPTFQKIKDSLLKKIYRLEFWFEFFNSHIKKTKPDYVGLEDYAYGKSMGAHQMGEVGGFARLGCFKKDIPFRTHNPLSVKMYTAGHGHADKLMMKKAVKEKWNVDFSHCDPPMTNRSKKQNTAISEDLADAFGIAKLIYTEVQLRSGEILLKDLDEKEIRIFTRITKAYPTNLLDRDWIKKIKEPI